MKTQKGRVLAHGVKILDDSNSTIDHGRRVREAIVDPHVPGESFILPLSVLTRDGREQDPATYHPPTGPKPTDHIDDRREELFAELRKHTEAQAKKPTVRPRREDGVEVVGRVVMNADGGEYDHPTAKMAEHRVTPPTQPVLFDIPGYVLLPRRYHKVECLAGHIALWTDKRHAGSAEFYPYTSPVRNQDLPPIGVYVAGVPRLFLLEPRPSVLTTMDPFEVCVLAVLEAKDLSPQEAAEYARVLSREGPVHGEASRDRAGADPGRAGGEPVEDGVRPGLSDLEPVLGGGGGVL